MGLFVAASPNPKIVDLEALALRDVIVGAVVLDDNDAATDFAIGGRRFDPEGSDMTMVLVPCDLPPTSLLAVLCFRPRPRSTTRARRSN
jgi:hypothetical protein